MSESIGINVGGADMKEAAGPLAAAITQILASPVEQETLRKALEVFGRSVTPENITITNCHLVGPRTITIDGEKAS